jgi:hypothetical protein
MARNQKWTQEVCDEYAKDLDDWIETTQDMLLEKWLIKHKLHYEHFRIFCERSESFLETYTRARMTIDARLIESALTRKIEINALKFYLVNRSHNWREKPDIQITSNEPLSKLLESIDGQSKNIIEVKPQTPNPCDK